MTNTMKIYYSDDCLAHDMGYGHPEQPDRIAVVREYLQASPIAAQLNWSQPEPASQEMFYLAHTNDYVDEIFANAPVEGSLYLDPDTSMSPGSLLATQQASGAAIAAIDLVTELAGPAFCLTRPPGHHAEAHRAMGFCIFNHVAVAAGYARQQGYKRIAIADFDVHHGNGTEHIVAGQDEILFLSSFQSPFYPFSGTEKSATNVLNSPYSAGLTSAEFRRLIASHWQPALTAFQPEILIISAGFDAHRADAISQANLTEEDYYWVSQMVCDWTKQSVQGRIVSVLEGGYNLAVLGPSVEAHLHGLLS